MSRHLLTKGTLVRRSSVLVLVVAIAVALAPAAALAAPDDGNGTKSVTEFDFTVDDALDCGGGNLLDVGFDGWFQLKEYGGEGNSNVDLRVVHLVLTFTNESGDSFGYHDVGADRLSVDGEGNLVLVQIGRIPEAFTGFQTGFSVIGRAVMLNYDPSTVSANGKVGPEVIDQACAALT